MKRQPVTRRDPKARKPRKVTRAESPQFPLAFRPRLNLRPIVVAGYVR